MKFIRIDGSTPSHERHSSVEKFQNDDTIRVAVLSILAAGVGLTLTAASTVVFAEMHWTPGILEQVIWLLSDPTTVHDRLKIVRIVLGRSQP